MLSARITEEARKKIDVRSRKGKRQIKKKEERCHGLRSGKWEEAREGNKREKKKVEK